METYYMDSATPLPRYYPLPQFLLDLNISSTSKILYAVLLNRANISQKNAWQDERGQVYCVYTIEELAADMNKGQTAIKNSLNELSKLGLLERVRAEFGRANHLYIKIPKGVETVAKPPAIESERQMKHLYYLIISVQEVRNICSVIWNTFADIIKMMRHNQIKNNKLHVVYCLKRSYN